MALCNQYVGEMKNQLRHGYGVYLYKNGYFKYEGEWQAGFKHGHGRLTMGDGSYYEGQFNKGEMEGNGFRWWQHSGNEYTGEFLLGEMHGEGVMKYSNGVVYEGQWFRNKREGRGVLRTLDGNYVGDFHDNKRHGQGTMTYTNGDIYVGNWVLDKRQGHGELTLSDGSVYQGQWLSDMTNGIGVMMHSSGVIYDGLWRNDRPVHVATKVWVTDLEGPVLELTQGQSFTIGVECRNEEDEAVPEQGRLLQISAGYRHMVAKEGSSLFDAIEDVEENPFSTPFGYDAVSFPLTDNITDELRLEPLDGEDSNETLNLERRSGTNLSDTGSTEPVKSVETDTSKIESTEPTRQQTMVHDDAHSTMASSPVPPPICPVRTADGKAEWTTLLLPAAPPLYRPYMIEDDDTAAQGVVKSKSRTGEPGKKPRSEDGLKTVKSNGDERFARPGEYVLKVEDVTDPPFMGVPLEPAFILIKHTIDQRRAPKSGKPVKEKKKWDTSAFIASAVQSGIS